MKKLITFIVLLIAISAHARPPVGTYAGGGGGGGVPSTRLIDTTAPLTGGGDLSANRNISMLTSGVTPGNYVNAAFTVDQFGLLTLASSGVGFLMPASTDSGQFFIADAIGGGAWAPVTNLSFLSNQLTVTSTSGPQLVLAYDGSNFTTGETDANGNFTFRINGGDYFRFWDELVISNRVITPGNVSALIEQVGSQAAEVYTASIESVLIANPPKLLDATAKLNSIAAKTQIRPGVGGNFTGKAYGLVAEVFPNILVGETSSGTMSAIHAEIVSSSLLGTIGEVNGLDVEPIDVTPASGTIGIARGIVVRGDGPAHSGTITEFVGLDIGPITHGVSNFAIRTGLGPVQFGDALSVAGTVTVGGLIELKTSETVADDASIDLPSGISGWGTVSAGDNQEWTQFRFSADGTVTLLNPTAGVVNTDTDTFLCVFDGGAFVRISNRLGAPLTLKIDAEY